MRLLLTGASGFFGRNLLDHLAGASAGAGQIELHVTARRVSDHHPPGDAEAGDTTGPRYHRVDLLDPSAVSAMLADLQPTHLCHLAWVGPEHQNRYHTPENHRWAEASRHLFTAFVESGGQRLVHLGSCIEYGNTAPGIRTETQPLAPDTTYGEAKAALSRFVTELIDGGLSAAVARPFFCYGPHEQVDRLVPSLIMALHEGRTLDLTEGLQIRDYLDVRDITAAIVKLLVTADATGPFNIGAGSGVTVRSIAEHLGRIAGRPELLNFGGRPEGPDSAPEIVADIGRITSATDWLPTIGLEKGLEHATEWWVNRRAAGPIS